jgi:hypothetical protein|tara:strand:- start:183 stop:497 length:315 start_codon:yes stop_codon:yes gene_type:complete
MSNIGNTKESAINYYHTNYPWEYYKNYPELCIKKMCMSEKEFNRVLDSIHMEQREKIIDKQYLLNIDRNSLQTLPPLSLRNRTVITNWLTASSLTFDDIICVGW